MHHANEAEVKEHLERGKERDATEVPCKENELVDASHHETE